MAKRGAESQITKDEQESASENEEDPGVRSQPLAPVTGRQIKGMPKRRGFGESSASPIPTPSASNAPPPVTFGGSTFGSSTSSIPPSSSASFSFGASTQPSSGFSFNATAPSSSGFSFTPPAPAAAAPAASPFTGFAFSKPTTSSPEKPPVSAVPVRSSFTSGFGQPKDSAPTSSGAFNFGQTSAPTSGLNPKAPSFAFGQTSASTPSEPQLPKDKPALTNPFAGLNFNKPSTTSAITKPTETLAASTASPAPSAGAAVAKPTATVSATNSEPPKSTLLSTEDNAAITTNEAIAPQPTQETPPDEGEVSYWTSLRGLNHSILTFLSHTLENDPFLDLSSCLPDLSSQYESYLSQAVKTAGWAPAKSSSTYPKSNGASAPSVPKAPTFALPKVGSFGLPPAKPTTPSGGFTLVPSSNGPSVPKAPFVFGKPSESSTSTPKKPSAEVNALAQQVLDEENKSTERQAPERGNGTVPNSTPSSEQRKSGLFSFAPSVPLQQTTPESKTFSPSSQLEKPNVNSPTQLGKFGPGGSQPQLAFGGAKSSPGNTAPVTSKPFNFAFGSSTTTSSGPTFNFASGPSTTPSFSFGATSNSTSTPAFTFGSTPSVPASIPAATSVTVPSESGTAGEEVEEPYETSKNLAETVGAGEEGEETIFEARAKLYRFTEGVQKLEGVGKFMLKSNTKEGDGKGKKRLLMRTDGSGNVILNMSLNKNINPTSDGFMVKFLGFDQVGVAAPYTLRVTNAQTAQEVVEVIKRERE
ncbi:hypothetical protein M231_02568 [Tremella mesenterica]|uniref:RanBD1 domain-containing protein n=1 Tax=Tremella mesenterica TaxID=5217 RepID=A0A4Q1BQA1_TREME|nr:hypothetical protein M231_02568 [Tremella mesenterica]